MLSPYQLQLLGLYLEISVFVPVLVPGSSDGSALLAGPGPGLVVVSKALHCAARPGPGCQQDHALYTPHPPQRIDAVHCNTRS